MKLGIVFAGQGAQKRYMGLDFYNSYSIFKESMDGFKDSEELKRLCFEAEMSELSQTKNTQPAMIAFGISIYKLLKSAGIEPEIVAGLSLGEYSALYSSNVLSESDTMSLVSHRGKIMQEASENTDSTMFAILGSSRESILKACEIASEYGIVEVCNYNSPSQIVISGEREAVEKAANLSLELGGKKAIELKVSGAFHTSLMNDAADKLRDKISEYQFNKMQVPIVFNSIGREKTKDESIQDLLYRQIKSSVYFQDSIEYMYEKGIDTIIEIGPSKILSGFIRKTQKNIKTYTIDNVDDFKNVIENLGA